MILFIILLYAIIAIAIMAILTAIIAGGKLLWWFGDIIVFSLIVWLIIKIIKRIKKK